MTLFAQWLKFNVIRYHYDNTTGSDYSGWSVTEGASNTIPPISAFSINPPTGKAFLCWNTVPDGSGDSYYPGDIVTPTGDMDLYPQWVKGVIVRYYPGSGAGTMTSVTTPQGVMTKLPKPDALDFTPKQGEIFVGWLIDGEDKLLQAGDEYTFDAGKRVTAQWAQRITIHYRWRSNSASSRDIQYIPKDIPVKLTTIENLGFTSIDPDNDFLGWALSPDAETPVYQDADTVCFSEDTTLYAVWFSVYVENTGRQYNDYALVGDVLSVGFHNENVFTEFAYQWFADGAEIPNAAAATYEVRQEDFGKAISCRVTATEDAVSYGRTKTSNNMLVTIEQAAEKKDR